MIRFEPEKLILTDKQMSVEPISTTGYSSRRTTEERHSTRRNFSSYGGNIG